MLNQTLTDHAQDSAVSPGGLHSRPGHPNRAVECQDLPDALSEVFECLAIRLVKQALDRVESGIVPVGPRQDGFLYHAVRVAVRVGWRSLPGHRPPRGTAKIAHNGFFLPCRAFRGYY